MAGRSRVLIFDPFAGASGDMILGALTDLGLPDDWLTGLVASLPIEGVEVRLDEVRRGAFRARRVRVEVKQVDAERHLTDVLEVIDRAPVPQRARELATAAFRRLAEVEGALHGVSAERVHFHEVGALDAIVDVLGAAAGVVELGVESCFTRPVAVGQGWIQAAHGRLPVPAPATLKLLEGLSVRETGWQDELTTPTGAVLLSVLTGKRPAPPEYTPLASGFGAGARDPESHPNVLRVILAEIGDADAMYMLQTDIDDMTAEYVPDLLEALRSAGAADVWTLSLGMKKGRPGLRVEALVPAGARESVSEALLRESSTIGLRFWPVDRQVLRRWTETIEWRGSPIRIKKSALPGGGVRSKPEYEDVRRAARALGIAPLTALSEIERRLESGNC